MQYDCIAEGFGWSTITWKQIRYGRREWASYSVWLVPGTYAEVVRLAA